MPRKPIAKKMRAKLKGVGEALRRRSCLPVDVQGRWMWNHLNFIQTAGEEKSSLTSKKSIYDFL